MVLAASDASLAQAAEPRPDSDSHCAFVTQGETVQIHAGILRRTLEIHGRNVATTQLSIDGQECLAGPAREVTFTVSFAQPNQRPRGLKPEEASDIETTANFSPGTDALRVSGDAQKEAGGVEWVREVAVRLDAWADHFQVPSCTQTQAATGTRLLVISASGAPATPLKDLKVELCYEIYDGFPVIRKWVKISNTGTNWLKLNSLVIDDLVLASDCRRQTPLTPSESGAGPSVVAFETQDERRGVIAVSEIPSALRQTRETGAMGYTDALFEWVLGPGEQFVSEPVFHYAYSGKVEKTVSGVSTPRDRAVEGGYLAFLRKHVGVAADQTEIEAPQWCSWSNFGHKINDAIVREQAPIAARCGFVMLLLDSGWQKDNLGTEPDPHKFPDFDATARYVRSLGLKLGLWVSCFRTEGASDLRVMPQNRSVPFIRREGGYGMSFASPWRKYYADDLTRLSQRYGAVYFKQDYTNVKFGDLAEGHEGRTLKDSFLRALRGLLESQDLLRAQAPGVASQISHEIYWGTPGVPCDVAALKHTSAYHIPPNDYSGQGVSKQRASEDWKLDPAKLSAQLIQGCFNARKRLYAHRGLPLYGVDYYGAHTVNYHGSLTPQIQDRQVCSWLMGAPIVFAGDLASLTEENIKRYRARFELLRRLEADYGIYRNFQFSGVPAPTDTDWHWWGKLNKDGAGAVVVMRGSGGENERAINIPWVLTDHDYQVNALLADKPLGRFSGKQLQDGALHLQLPPLGQEIVELKTPH